MSNFKICPVEAIYRANMWPHFLTPLIVLLQIGVLARSLYFECHHRALMKKIDCQQRVFYIVMQCIGLYYSGNDVVRFLIQPLITSNPSESLCHVLSWSHNIRTWLFYTSYLYMVFYRYYASFRGSVYEMRRCTFIVITSLMWSFCALSCIVRVMLSESPCLNQWSPSDQADTLYFYCSKPVAANHIGPFLVLFGVWIPYIILVNIVITIAFVVKLRGVLKGNDDNDEVGLKFKALIFKMTLLSGIGCISTFLGYGLLAVFHVVAANFFVYLDLLLNAIVAGLMFKNNQTVYNQCCRCCIVCCFDKYAYHGQVKPKSRPLPPINGSLNGVRSTSSSPRSFQSSNATQNSRATVMSMEFGSTTQNSMALGSVTALSVARSISSAAAAPEKGSDEQILDAPQKGQAETASIDITSET